MGHNLRTREAIALGENDSRRLSEIIESSKHAGWHTFEQSLLKAFEQDLITEETAMLYASNKPAMRQLVDTARSRPGFLNRRRQSPSMIVVPAAPKNVPPPEDLSKLGLV